MNVGPVGARPGATPDDVGHLSAGGASDASAQAPPHGLALGARGPEVAAIQKELAAAGFPCGAADGVFGRQTATAVAGFQKAHGLPSTGSADAETVAALAKVGVAQSPDVPADIAALGAQLGLGAFKGLDHAMGGRVCYSFEGGEVFAQNGKVDRVETKGGDTIPGAIATAAAQLGLGAFQELDHAMGGRIHYGFAGGEIFAQNGKIDRAGVTRNGETDTLPGAVVAESLRRHLGAFVRAEHAMGGRTIYAFEKGEVRVGPK